MFPNLAHSDLVADHLDRLTALGLSLRELTLHPADVFLQHLQYSKFSIQYFFSIYSTFSIRYSNVFSFITCRFLICCSISRAFRGFLPNISNPDVSRSRRWIVLRFFRPNS